MVQKDSIPCFRHFKRGSTAGHLCPVWNNSALTFGSQSLREIQVHRVEGSVEFLESHHPVLRLMSDEGFVTGSGFFLSCLDGSLFSYLGGLSTPHANRILSESPASLPQQ